MFLNKEVRVMLKGQALEAFMELKKLYDANSIRLVKSIERMIGVLKDNPQFGDPIKKELIPSEFIEMGITNIYRAELSNYWRMLYTLEGNRVEIFVFILKIFDHPSYDKLFGYRKR